jgi:hypothetical protein
MRVMRRERIPMVVESFEAFAGITRFTSLKKNLCGVFPEPGGSLECEFTTAARKSVPAHLKSKHDGRGPKADRRGRTTICQMFKAYSLGSADGKVFSTARCGGRTKGRNRFERAKVVKYSLV